MVGWRERRVCGELEGDQKDDRTNRGKMRSNVFDTNGPGSNFTRKRQYNEKYATDTVWEQWKKIDAAE